MHQYLSALARHPFMQQLQTACKSPMTISNAEMQNANIDYTLEALTAEASPYKVNV